MATVAQGVLTHHERIDGRGYPDGLIGKAIPRVGRIVMLADSFDAMVSDRTYRKAMPLLAAVAEIRRFTGTQFDPEVADAFFSRNPADLLDELNEVLSELELPFHEVIVVNDGSTDDTAQLANDRDAKVVTHAVGLGNGAAVKRGIREAKGDWILLLEGDLSALQRVPHNHRQVALRLAARKRQADATPSLDRGTRQRVLPQHVPLCDVVVGEPRRVNFDDESLRREHVVGLRQVHTLDVGDLKFLRTQGPLHAQVSGDHEYDAEHGEHRADLEQRDNGRSE